MTIPSLASLPEYHSQLQQVFGFSAFREGQEDVVRQLLAGKPALAVFPTGAGKSLCYQLPALLLDGLTLVISPLLALMKDQVDFLQSKGIAAARLDSTLELGMAQKVLKELTSGQLKILYIAPERLASERFLSTLRRLKISLLAIDEAHCISEWGHNFRPDYLKLARLARELKIRRVLALTATATPAVMKDIAREFAIGEEGIVNTGFYRPNLNLHVTPCRTVEKLPRLLNRLTHRPRGTTIVYVTLQKTAEEVAGGLMEKGLPARHYHAGMEAVEREKVQDWFMKESAPIVVATIAFGMGIDKADIRAVYHYDLPKSLENYAQEIGRAGRDGQPSDCELFACARDRRVLENFILGDTPSPEAVAGVVEELSQILGAVDVSMYELAGKYDIRPLVLETLLTYLEMEGVVKPSGPFYQEYKFQPLRTSKEILGRFDAERGEFLRKLFQQARKGKTWLSLDMAAVVETLKEPRERIVAALSYLADKGELILQPSSPRYGFFSRDLSPTERQDISQRLAVRFVEREKRDLARLRRVLDYAEHEGCATAYLLNYFGDNGITMCGHCSRCRGKQAAPLPAETEYSFSPADSRLLADLLAERNPALASPRQLTRFLCGLSSPAATRAKLNRDRRFGKLGDYSFEKVLQWVEQTVANKNLLS